MTAAAPTDVCIIIAAKNAADTIARAVASALAEPEAEKSSSSMTARPMRALRWHALRMTERGG